MCDEYISIFMNFLLKVVKELSLFMNGILVVSLHNGSERINDKSSKHQMG